MRSGLAGPWPLIGRVEELDVVIHALRRARGVVLSGPPGVGKSRLAAELVDASRDAGWRVVSLSAGPENDAVPFATFLPLLDDDTGGDAAMLLVQPNAIPDVVAQTLASLDPTAITVLGGTAAISMPTEVDLAAFLD